MLKFCQNILPPLLSSAGRQCPISTIQRNVKSVFKKLGLPSPPKKPMNLYALFVKEHLPLLKLQHPESKTSDLMAMVGRLWKDVDESQKIVLKEKADLGREAYEKAKTVFEEEVKPHEVKILEAEKSQILKQSRKDLAKLGKPKRPASAFALFMSSHKSSRGDLPVPQFTKVMAKKWKELPEHQKKEYHDIYLNDVKLYEKKLEDWEKKMIAEGLQELLPLAASKEPKKKQPLAAKKEQEKKKSSKKN